MPLHRSPPSGNTRNKTILKSSLLTGAQLTDVSASSRVKDSLPALHIPQNNSSELRLPTNELSWSSQCITPQLSVPPAHSPNWSTSFVSTTTTTTSTTTYCSSIVSATESIFSSTSSAVTTPATVSSLPSTTTTSSTSSNVSQASLITKENTKRSKHSPNPTAVSAKLLSSTTTTSSTSSSEPVSQQSSPIKENTKRNRSSPNITATVSKKKKPKITQPKKNTHYWLGESPTSNNKFAILDTIDLENETVSLENASETQNMVISKPPPIFIQGVERIGVLQNALNNIADLKYELQILRNNEVKISSTNIDQYNILIDFLNSKNTEYYTFKPKHLKGFKVILRNMHYSTDLDEIKQELAELGHEVLHIQNMIHSHNKQPMSLFSLELKLKSNNNNIFSVNDLLHCKVTFEKPHKKRTPPQCTNCQKYGHTKNFCTKRPICVKCAGEHKTSDCMVTLNRDQIKCALCGDNHTSNYRGCRIYKSLINKNQPVNKPTAFPNLSHKNKSTEVSDIIPGKSYANAVTSNNAPAVTSNIAPALNAHASDINELKDMVKQLLAQVSNMMNFMVLVLNKLNVTVT